MDGYGLPSAHVARAADLGMSALALTEHGNVSSHVKLELAAKAAGIKPIFGLEAYTAPSDMREKKNRRKWHQTMLAMDQGGYQNLNTLVTQSWDEGFYQWPTIHWEMLRDHHEGLIVTSGCADGLVACALLGGKGIDPSDASPERALRVVRGYQRLLGDRYYLETQQFPELERTRAINTWLEEAARRTGVPLVATADCHYPLAEQNELQKILHAAGRNTGTVAAAEATWEYDIRLTFPQSDKFLLDRLRATGLSRIGAEQALSATDEIAQRCNVALPKMDRVRFPIETDPRYRPGMSTLDVFRLWLNDGWAYRGFAALRGRRKREYIERVEYETRLFVEKDFLHYFMMLSDAVRACKDNGIPVGPARGSAAASLVCYLLRITEVNPMQYPLMLFERFVDPNRHDLPDVDLDFDDDLRDFVRQHLVRRFGADHVGNIGTFTKYKGKNSIDDVARVYQIPRFAIEQVKEFLVVRSGGDSRADASIEDSIAMFPQVKAVFDQYPQLYRAIELEGNYKQFGVHAAGIVVGAERLTKSVALYTRHNVGKAKKTLSVLSVDKYDGEELGLLKLDALGLSTMGMIRIALGYIGMTLDELYAIPLDEPDTIASFNRGDVKGIFQFDGRTMKMVTEELKPDKFMDLAAINALARPGPFHSGQTADYIAVRHGLKERESLHPLVDEICAATEGQIIYQEQVLEICRRVGNFPWVHAATIRKVIAQKKGEAAFNALWGDFEKGAAENGIESELARRIWNKMVTSGTYSFNIAHCISYSILGFWAMWLKVHHPIAFYAAQLQKVNEEKQLELMRDMQDKRFGRSYRVHSPHPNRSGLTWTPHDDGVYAGLSQIPGIGDKMAEAIVHERTSNGDYASWDDLIAVSGIGAKKIASIKEFCEQEDPFGILKIQKDIAEIKRCIKEGILLGLPMPTHRSDEIPYEDRKVRLTVCGTVKQRNPQDMFEDHRARTGEDLDPDTIKDPHLKDSMTLFMEDDGGRMTVKISRWLYPRLKQQLWGDVILGHHYVLAACEKKPYYGKVIHVRQMWVIDPCDGKCVARRQSEEDEDVA